MCLVSRFGNDLQVSDKLFVVDAGASNSKDMKLLRIHLQELRTNIISVSSTLSLFPARSSSSLLFYSLMKACAPPLQRCSPMTLLSERLLATLPAWRKLSGPNQLTSWQQFVSDVQEHINPLVSQDHLRSLALQLHSMGEVSERRSAPNTTSAASGKGRIIRACEIISNNHI